jgi:hypothetical protein
MTSEEETTGHGGAREGAGRPKSPKRELRANRVTLNLTDAELRDLSARAKRSRMTLQQLLLKAAQTWPKS